ncbi:hypothetical protein QL285_062119 [Trifolium repens]|nr:hypothetical protein QL285_062119 [Trifolium repens]
MARISLAMARFRVLLNLPWRAHSPAMAKIRVRTCNSRHGEPKTRMASYTEHKPSPRREICLPWRAIAVKPLFLQKCDFSQFSPTISMQLVTNISYNVIWII